MSHSKNLGSKKDRQLKAKLTEEQKAAKVKDVLRSPSAGKEYKEPELGFYPDRNLVEALIASEIVPKANANNGEEDLIIPLQSALPAQFKPVSEPTIHHNHYTVKGVYRFGNFARDLAKFVALMGAIEAYVDNSAQFVTYSVRNRKGYDPELVLHCAK